MHRPSASVCLAAAVFSSSSASAGDEPLTLGAALQRARAHAPALVAARFRVDEARARLDGARALRDEPTLEAALGRRRHGPSPDLELGLSQTFELGGRRSGRIRAAEAAGEREAAAVDDLGTRVLREAGLAFVRAQAAAERTRLGAANEAHAESVLTIAERRHALGDVADLDVNLAAGAHARARSEARAAAAQQALAEGELRALLALDPGAPLVLAAGVEPRPAPALEALLEAAERRADVRGADAEVREAEAEGAVGRGLRWPDVTPSVRYEREGGEAVLWGGVALSLPVWGRGREVRGVADARAARARSEAHALRRTARLEVESAFRAQRLRLEAVDVLRDSAARLADNEALARRAYEVGQIGLAEVLLARRETVEGRLVLLARRAEAAEGEIDLLARAGVLR
jgi:cobalt-zinc-cadmium efflux system outer membrane protein